MNSTQLTSIGSGAYFPIELSNIGGKTTWVPLRGDIRLINQNLMAIFSTQVGQMFRNEYFGSRLVECLEEPDTQALQLLVKRFTKDAIESWEPRIEFLESSVTADKSSLILRFRYRVKMDQNIGELNFSYNPQTNNIEAL